MRLCEVRVSVVAVALRAVACFLESLFTVSPEVKETPLKME